MIGVVFASEFICLFLALDLTTVTRTSVLLYTMPIWLALAAHVLIPGERLTVVKSIGLAMAFAGMVVALVSRGGSGGEATVAGDLLALVAAVFWACIALIVRTTALKTVSAEVQLLWQLVISAPILFLAAVFFGPFLRDPAPIHWAGLGFQIVAVVSAGFLFWFWLLKIYPASSVAAFAFLAPVFGVSLGWLILGEPIGPGILIALVLVCAGLVLINRPAPKPERNPA
jgi:drug/metabolite transporter (DMT)-like permease